MLIEFANFIDKVSQLVYLMLNQSTGLFNIYLMKQKIEGRNLHLRDEDIKLVFVELILIQIYCTMYILCREQVQNWDILNWKTPTHS